MLGTHRHHCHSHFPGPWLHSALGAVLLLVLGTCIPAMAGTFNVIPPRLELDPGQRAGTVEVVSGQDKPLLIRATLNHWTQANGQDIYEPTEEIAVVPPVFKLEGNARQVLRVGFLGRPRPQESENAYRLLLTEVTDGIPDAEDEVPVKGKQLSLMIKTRLTINMPIYVLPRRNKDVLRATTQVDADGKPRVVLSNAGSVHQRMEKVELVGGNGRSVPFDAAIFVLLPGATRSLALNREAAALPPPYRLRFFRESDDGREIDVTAP